MSPETSTNTTKICPTCGTRLNINATRCSVCGSTLASGAAVASNKAVQGPRIPEVTLSLPVLFGMVILVLAIGAGSVFAYIQSTMTTKMEDGKPVFIANTETPTASATVTITMTPTEAPTETPQPTWTPLPTIEYHVQTGDTCLSIAYVYNISVNSILQMNQLGSDCILSIGKTLYLPQPSPSPSPQPTNTPNETEIAATDCPKVEYVVEAGNTLGMIAGNYNVSSEAIKAYNGLTTDNVLLGQKLVIPLCARIEGTNTPTPVPPYPFPNLLLPADGAFFKSGDVVTLQWASVGELRQNEAYAVTIIDATDSNNRKPTQYVTDTKLIVPDDFKPSTADPHVFYWTVLPVRQTGTDKDSGNPVWEPAGEVSAQRSFSWAGGGPEAPTKAP